MTLYKNSDKLHIRILNISFHRIFWFEWFKRIDMGSIQQIFWTLGFITLSYWKMSKHQVKARELPND